MSDTPKELKSIGTHWLFTPQIAAYTTRLAVEPCVILRYVDARDQIQQRHHPAAGEWRYVVEMADGVRRFANDSSLTELSPSPLPSEAPK